MRNRPRCAAVIVGMALQSLTFVCGVLPAWAQVGSPASEPQRPAFQIGSAGRFNEDWSVLRGADLGATDDFWDRLKFIPLTPDGSVWLTFSGQVRERAEYFRQFLFGASQPEQSDAYLLLRVRLSADLHVTPYVRLFAEGRSAFALDRDLQGGRTTAFVDEFDLMNGFADIMIPLGDRASATLRGGRQELIFGSQRLVGPGDFTQVPRSFDGDTAIGRIADWTIIPFWAEAVPIVQKYRFNESTSDHKLFGIFSTGPLHLLPVNLDLYWLGVDNAAATFNGTAGREHRQTLGGRTVGKIGQTPLDFEVEGASQFGSVGHGNIAAWMLTTVLGYALPIPQWSPRLTSSSTMRVGTSGRAGPSAPSISSFRMPIRTLGYIDYIGRQNIISASGGLIMTPIRDLTLSLQQYFFWRASDRDALYNKAGAVLRSGTGTTARYVGAEMDLLATYNVTRHLQFYAGYSHFFTGEFIRKTGPSRDSDFMYGAIQYTF